MSESAELQATLERLAQQLQDAEDLDADARARLAELLEETREALERQTSGDGERSLADRLSEAAQHFEESHPSLATALGRLVDTLASLGI